MTSDSLLWMYEQHRRCSPEDAEFWREAGCYFPGLDERGHQLPYGSCPHCIKAFRLFVKTHNPQRLFEIEFNNGNSAKLLLKLGVPHVTSCDVRDTPQVRGDMADVAMLNPESFSMFLGPSHAFDPCDVVYDSAYVDGDHTKKAILEDIAVCRRIGITKFLFDDFFPMHGDTIEAVKESGLTVDWICGNMLACTDVDRSAFLQF